MIDYDREAASYDGTRGGPERAAAAAEAIGRLLTSGPILDVACGTGIVTARLKAAASRANAGAGAGVAERGVRAGSEAPVAAHVRSDLVFGVDRSAGMLGIAAARLAGRVLRGDAGRMPIASGAVGSVLMVWLLHLVPAPEAVLEEAVRVLRTDGRLITTVDKGAAAFAVPSDLAEATAPWRDPDEAADRFERVAAFLGGRGLHPAGEATFPGVGQGRSPRRWREAVRSGHVSWAAADPDGVDRALAGLPDQDRARPEPVYRLVAFSAGTSRLLGRTRPGSTPYSSVP